jgi:magnesium transporter
MAYGPGEFTEQQIQSPEALASFIGKWPVLWINVDGLGDAEAIRKIGEIFGIHPLALEDVIHAQQRPKVEPYENYLFIIMQMLLTGDVLDMEQLSLFLGKNFVLTFQERPGGDCFPLVRDRIRRNHARIRGAGADHLAYALVDAVVDYYFPLLERYGERLETVEDEVVARPSGRTVANIHRVKRDLLMLRRTAWPMREAINSLVRDESPFIARETRTYLRDCYDHAVRIIDILETDRETAFGLLETYLSATSNRMNEVIKVLTVITTIFMPLTFIAGIYGMNFMHMPELSRPWGYPAVLASMAAIGLGMLFYFRRKGWLGPRSKTR